MPLWPFQSKLPVDDASRKWVDQRMQWLAGQFGMQTLRTVRAVEPTDEFFPDPYDRTEAAVKRMMLRICVFMSVDPHRVELQFYSNAKPKFIEHSKNAAGIYRAGDKEIIAIDVANLDDPTVIVATLAHELAHARLLGERRLTGQEEDHELATDLATVFFGLGIFNANSTFRFSQWTRGQLQGWNAATLGYMKEPMFGYALGLWATMRNEPAPKWMRHLRLNPRTYMKRTTRFLAANPPEPFS